MHLYTKCLLALALALPLMASCSTSKPTRLYVLTSKTTRSAAVSTQEIPIGIGPVTLPKYLDRPQVITHVATNSLAQADLDQWGGDLADNITRVLATNLANLLNTERVSLYPWTNGAPIDYQITLDVAKFELDSDGSSVLDVFWSLVKPSDGKVLAMRRSTYREGGTNVAALGPIDGATRSYDAVAAAMSSNLEALSRDIAMTIKGQSER
jgi:uncharacterized lipoprotein YmbA